MEAFKQKINAAATKHTVASFKEGNAAAALILFIKLPTL